VDADVAVVQAQVEEVPAITITTEEQITTEDKTKGVYGQLKELLESDKQQQVRYSIQSVMFSNN